MTPPVAPSNSVGAEPSFGVRLPNSGPFATAAAQLEIAASADALGYDSVWVHDHISWGHTMLTHFAAGSIEACADQDPNFFESLSTIGFLGGRFPRLTIGVAGLVIPLRDPRLLAKQLSTLDHLSGGRVIIAAAIGNISNDFDVVGVPYKKRARITAEYLQALRVMLAGESAVDFSGEFINFGDGTFLPRPLGLQIWLAGSSEPGLARAVNYGDGWLTVYQSVDGYRQLSDRLSALATESGREPATLERGYETYVSIADSYAEAERSARASMLHSFKDLARGLDVCLIGSPQDIGERIAKYRAAGAQHFEFKFYCRSLAHMTEQMGLLADILRLNAPATKVEVRQ